MARRMVSTGVAVLVLAGCNSAAMFGDEPEAWSGTDAEGKTVAEAIDECVYAAEVATASMPGGMERGFREVELRDRCMNLRGLWRK